MHVCIVLMDGQPRFVQDLDSRAISKEFRLSECVQATRAMRVPPSFWPQAAMGYRAVRGCGR